MGCLHVPRDLLSHNVFLSTYILYSTIYTTVCMDNTKMVYCIMQLCLFVSLCIQNLVISILYLVRATVPVVGVSCIL